MSVFIPGRKESLQSVYLVAALLVVFGFLSAESPLWVWATPVVAGAFLGITGGLLLWDLEHPKRFYLIFTRPQWRSWLVKGAFIIAGYTLVLALHFLGSLMGWKSLHTVLLFPGIPLAILSAVYTAYLFAQAKRVTCGKTHYCPLTCFVQALLLGSALLLPLSMYFAVFAESSRSG